MSSRRFRLLFLFTAAILLGGCNLAGDVTPPPGAPTLPSAPGAGRATEAPVSLAPPADAPDPGAGAVIYAERCAPCHGEAGLSDGPQAADLPTTPSALGDPELAEAVTPLDWYHVVSQGRMDGFMPAFTSLTSQQRWDVVAYVLSLSGSSQEQSAELYQELCADCHGPEGAGDQDGPGLLALGDWARRTREQVAAAVRTGFGDAMPAFQGQLSERQIGDLAAYVQALPLEAHREPVGQAEAEPDQGSQGGESESSVALSGQVMNGTSGEPVERGLTVTLHGFDGQQQVLTERTEVGPEGQFEFSDLELVPGRLFIVSADYGGVRYTSEAGHLQEAEDGTELLLTVYESTADPSEVVAPRLHVLMDRPAEGSVRVVELWILVNQGRRTVTPVDGQGGLEIALPLGATNLRFEDSLLAERYQPTENGFRLLAPIRPGESGAQVVFSLDLPLKGDSALEQPLQVAVESAIVLVADGGPRIQGDGLREVGVRQAAGEQFHQYDVGPLAAGDTLRLSLQEPPLWQKLVPRQFDPRWVVGSAALVLVLAGVAYWYRPWIREEESQAEDHGRQPIEQRRRSLLQAIADLDDAFGRGKVEETAYRHRRQELKAELMSIIDQADD